MSLEDIQNAAIKCQVGQDNIRAERNEAREQVRLLRVIASEVYACHMLPVFRNVEDPTQSMRTAKAWDALRELIAATEPSEGSSDAN